VKNGMTGEDRIKFRDLFLKTEKMKAVLKVQHELISRIIRDFLREEGFVEIQAPVIGPVTDPGIRGAKQVSFDYYGQEYKIMSSMILYKQIAVGSLDKIYAFSPNIRLEPLEAADTKRHLAEFYQVDLEAAYWDYKKAMALGERLLKKVCLEVTRTCSEELFILERDLKIPKIPFEKFTYEEIIEEARKLDFRTDEFGELSWKAEEALSRKFGEPFWILDYPVGTRGFYYLEDPERKGILKSMDLIYSEGYGEAISGGEREYKYSRVKMLLEKSGEKLGAYKNYLEILKRGIPPSAGFGIGVERLTKFICGLEEISESTPFPKLPGFAYC
jgi:asparaginyl-tRNA synthetase